MSINRTKGKSFLHARRNEARTPQASRNNPYQGPHEQIDTLTDQQKASEIQQLEEIWQLDSAQDLTISPSEVTEDAFTTPEDDEDTIDLKSDATNDEEHLETPKHGRLKRIRARMASISLMSDGLALAEKITAPARARREEREKRYEVNENDSRFTRVKKFIGRNGMRAVAMATGAATYGAFIALKIDHAVDSMNDINNLAQQSIDIQNTAYGTRYIIGGRGQGDGEGLARAIDMSGAPRADKTVPIRYPAEMAPLPGDKLTLDQSSQIVSDRLYAEYQRQNGKPMEVGAHSLGTVGTIDFLNRIKDKDGNLPPNVKAVLYAPEQVPVTGLTENPIAKAGSPILDALGYKKLHQEIPAGTIVVAKDTDVISNSANKPLTTTASQAIGYMFGDGHNVPLKEDPVKGVVKIDGVTYVTHGHAKGPQTAALRVAERSGILVTRGMDEFGQAIAPQGLVGQSTHIDPNKVVKAGSNLIKEGLNDRGIKQFDPVLDQISRGVPQPSAPAPQPQPAPMPTPQWNAPAPNWNPTPTPAPAPAPAPIDMAPVNKTIDDFQSTTPLPKEVNQAVDGFQKQASQFLGGFKIPR